MEKEKPARKHQRYLDSGERLLVGCVPFRFHDGVLHILLITNRKEDGWILPKGGWENHETAEVGACRETREEAGVIGNLGELLGQWKFSSKKGKHSNHISFFGLQVTEVLSSYEEQHRERKWFHHEEAVKFCHRPEMVAAITELLKRTPHPHPQK